MNPSIQIALRTLRSTLLACSAACAAVCAASSPASAGNHSASFQASITILGSCAVDTGASLGLRPQVACNYADAYRLDLLPQQNPHGDIWTVTF